MASKPVKPSDIKRIDPIDKTRKSHKKKKYPLHLEIRQHSITSNKYLKLDSNWKYELDKEYLPIICYKRSGIYDEIHILLKVGNLDAALEIYTKHHPETKDWPVRFIGIQPLSTTREVIS